MKIEFEITEEELLRHHLFATAHAESIRKRRLRGRILLIIIYLIAGFFIWKLSSPWLAGLFFVSCVPLFFLYTRMESKQYLKQLKALVKEQIRERKNKITKLHFEKDHVTMADGELKSRIPLADINAVYEIRELYSLRLRNGQSIVLPKNHSNSKGDTNEGLQQLAERLEIPFIQQIDWEWK